MKPLAPALYFSGFISEPPNTRRAVMPEMITVMATESVWAPSHGMLSMPILTA